MYFLKLLFKIINFVQISHHISGLLKYYFKWITFSRNQSCCKSPVESLLLLLFWHIQFGCCSFIVVSLAKVSHQVSFALFFIPCLVFPLSKLLVKSHCWLCLPQKAQHPCRVWNPPMYCLGSKKRCWEGPGPQVLATLCHLVLEGILLVSKISPNLCKQWFHWILALLLPTIEIKPAHRTLEIDKISTTSLFTLSS